MTAPARRRSGWSRPDLSTRPWFGLPLLIRLCFALRRMGRWRPAGRKQRLKAVLATLGVMSAVTGVALAAAGAGLPASAVPGPATAQAARTQAAAWVARQVSPDVIVSCDPQMCAQLRASGFPAAGLAALSGSAAGLRGSALVVATPAVRDQFGARLAAVEAPLVIASFGTGAAQVDVRAVAPDGATAFWRQVTVEHAALVSAGRQLARNTHVGASASARAMLLAGRVDPRLLVMLSALASQAPIRLVAFDDGAPGGNAAVPLRGVQIGAASPAAGAAILAFLRAQQPPYRPAAASSSRAAGGQLAVTMQFDVTGPAGAASP